MLHNFCACDYLYASMPAYEREITCMHAYVCTRVQMLVGGWII